MVQQSLTVMLRWRVQWYEQRCAQEAWGIIKKNSVVATWALKLAKGIQLTRGTHGQNTLSLEWHLKCSPYLMGGSKMALCLTLSLLVISGWLCSPSAGLVSFAVHLNRLGSKVFISRHLMLLALGVPANRPVSLCLYLYFTHWFTLWNSQRHCTYH